MLRELKMFPIKVSTISNGTLLKDDLARELVQLGLDRLVLSVDAVKPETYASIRTPGNLQDVFAGLESVKKWKHQLGRSLPTVELVFLGMKRNIGEFPDFVRMAHRLGTEKVTLQALGEYELVRGESIAMNYKETGRRFYEQGMKLGSELGLKVELFPRDQFEEDRGARNMTPSFDRLCKDCSDPWLRAVITTTGNILPCCSSKVPLGNLSMQSFAEIWHGHAYKTLRDQINSSQPPQMCRVCTGMPWVPRSVRRELKMIACLCGVQMNRTFGNLAVYQRIKPFLKSVRNFVIGKS